MTVSFASRTMGCNAEAIFPPVSRESMMPWSSGSGFGDEGIANRPTAIAASGDHAAASMAATVSRNGVRPEMQPDPAGQNRDDAVS